MDRVLTPRIAVSLAYLFVALAGLAFIALPTTDTIARAAGFGGLMVWHAFLVLGGCIGLVSIWKKVSLVELSALILLATALLVYAISVFASLRESATPGTSTGVALLFISMMMGIVARGLEIRNKRRIDTNLRKRSG